MLDFANSAEDIVEAFEPYYQLPGSAAATSGAVVAGVPKIGTVTVVRSISEI